MGKNAKKEMRAKWNFMFVKIQKHNLRGGAYALKYRFFIEKGVKKEGLSRCYCNIPKKKIKYYEWLLKN